MSSRYPYTPIQEEIEKTLRSTEQAMMEDILKAIGTAQTGAKAKLRAIDPEIRTPEREFFSIAALRKLFLLHCGADIETGEAGDAWIAERVLDVGRDASRSWAGQKDARQEHPSTAVESADDVTEGAHRFALKIVIRALLDRAMVNDPDLPKLITEAVDDHITKLAPQSERERDFADKVKLFAEALSGPPHASTAVSDLRT